MRRQPSVLDQIQQAALDDARRLGHGWVGVEHLFMTLLRIESGVTVAAVRRLGQDPRTMRRQVREHVGAGQQQDASAQRPPSPRAGRVMELAGMIAQQQGGREPGELHLLLAILQDGPNAALRVLAELGVDPDAFSQAAQVAARRPAGAGGGDAGEEGPVLERGRDLTALAREGELHAAIGRASEMVAVAQTLVRKSKNNPVLIGEAGVGKTAIVEGLAYRIAQGDVHPDLRDKRVIELSPATLVAGTTLRGQFEERMNRLVEEARSQPDVIVFFDELHTLLGAGAAQQSPMDAAQILKPALARGEIKCIGATTIEEYRRYVESDAALERRFQPVMVAEPSPETTLQILQAVKERYEEHHHVSISDEVLDRAVVLAGRYVPDRRFPDKALDLLDQACARTRMLRLTYRAEDQAASGEALAVQPETVGEVVAQWTGRPAADLTGDERERMLRLEEELGQHVIGQPDAVAQVSGALRASAAGLRGRNRPQAVFIFLGPTGVGKTELAKELARFLFGSRDAVIRLDMSDYMEKHNVARLVGAPPGYVGHEEEGQLTGALRTTPHAVVLLDEIEKAHPDVFDLFLQVFDDGRLTDAKGRVIDCRDAIFIMTSNIGTDVPGLFDGAETEATADQDERVREALLGRFRPEFLNRVDDIIVFRPLGGEHIRQIAELMLAELRERLGEQEVRLHLTEGAWQLITTAGYDPQFGARPLRRAIERLLTRPLSDLLLSGACAAGQLLVGSAEGDRIAFEAMEGTDG